MTRRTVLAIAGGSAITAAAVVVASVVVLGIAHPQPHSTPSVEAPVVLTAIALEAAYLPPTPAELAALPEARYDAVIARLLQSPSSTVVAVSSTWSLATDVAVYGAGAAPAARLPALNFLGQPTVVVSIEHRDDWMLVLTPARRSLPSASGGSAPAQTAGWVRADALLDEQHLDEQVVVSVSARTISIVDSDQNGGPAQRSWPVGIGMAGTPTPTGVTGYLQERYFDPAQGQQQHRVQLTSLHSAAADEPFGGSDGGLIGIHYARASSGALSHGCIRLPAEAIDAIDALPLGTLVRLDP
ncbi:MAG: hypothetical protein JWO10_1935 [Microbacteriaceae bacterium]|nr:hypothetical protein [Microbacteriaceae bacterium]